MIKRSCVRLLLLVLILLLPFTYVQADGTGITRGVFFKEVSDQLNLKPVQKGYQFPPDVLAGSDYANSVQVLMERGIIEGYPDGTVKINKQISKDEAAIIIARLLNVKEKDAGEILSNQFQLELGNETLISKKNATEAIQKVLKNDLETIKTLEKMIKEFSALQSYKLRTKSNVEMIVNEEETVNTSVSITQAFHNNSGLYQKIETMFPFGVQYNHNKVIIEEYLVPEGDFIKIGDLFQGDGQWEKKPVNPSFPMMDTFKMDSLALFSEENESVFYHDLGKVTIEGKQYNKIRVSGFIPISSDIELGGVSSIVSDESQNNLSIKFSGFILIDSENNLPHQQKIDYYLKPFSKENLAPFKEMTISMEIIYSDYNSINSIELLKNISSR